MDARNIVPPIDAIELAAGVEVTKTIALTALSVALAVMGGDTKSNADHIKTATLLIFANTNIALPQADAKKYRDYAEACIEELFGRLTIGDQQVNPKSS